MLTDQLYLKMQPSMKTGRMNLDFKMELLQAPYNLQGKNVQGTKRACGGVPPSGDQKKVLVCAWVKGELLLSRNESLG
jgi:hypothetical protein